jgi:hypothetical protein
MKVVDIANEIYIEQGSPTTTSIPAIAYWVRAKAGLLNTMLYEDFVVNDGLEIINGDGSEIPTTVVSIVKQMYKVYDLEIQVRNLMNALASDGLIEVTDNLGGTSFKRVNRNEMAKTILQLRKDELKVLADLIDSYRSLTSQPSQVAGDDTTPGYHQLYPAYPLMVRRY